MLERRAKLYLYNSSWIVNQQKPIQNWMAFCRPVEDESEAAKKDGTKECSCQLPHILFII